MATTAGLTTVPAPIGGLNAYDNYMAMPETDALKMVNLVPSPYGCTVRRGYKQHSKDLGDPVGTIVPHAELDGTFTLYAVAGGTLYDVTIPGTGVSELSSLVADLWYHVSVANAAGTHTVMFSGSDNPIWIHNNTIKRLIAGNGTDDATWSGVDPELLVQGTIHQKRLWAVERDSTRGWYLAADSFYGSASYFDFGPLFKRGGYLAALGTWSADVGEGADDHLVAVSSQGEVAVYAGLDPNGASAWKLRGVYYIGVPVSGRRFMTNIGGDLLFLTSVGVVSMGTVLTSSTVAATSDTAYSRKIQHLLNNEIAARRSSPGWALHFFPEANLLYINMPTVYEGGSVQLVANYINQAWCTFADVPAAVWASVSGRQFFGAEDGFVYESWTGNTDKQDTSGLGGVPIVAECQQSYSYFDSLGVQKQVGLYRPNILSVGTPGFVSEILYDFVQGAVLNPSALPGVMGASIWDTDLWDGALWGGSAQIFRPWRSALGMGNAVSLRIAFSTEKELTWVGTDYVLNVGGPI